MLTTSTRRARLSALLTATVLAASATLLGAPAHADDSATLTVVGTSDVFDSNLVTAVIKPGFEKAYPQYTLNYISKGTGAAIAYAEAGTASALVVHAASLENQFVADGYSMEPYGRAIFWGDYVLLGPASDPAGVMSGAPHDAASAFEKIAAAGQAGTADFVSRGGTPGTTVQEHAIWALTNGVTTCNVSDGNGGGTSPSTASGACPSTISYPNWYHATGLTQGPNITNADACNYPGRSGKCYTITDRGTFNYLQSTGQAQNLKIVTRDNAATARGGVPLLVNSFHAYGLKASKFAGTPSVQINSAAASKFLGWITSAAAQKAIGNYLNGSNDPPFLPSASPTATATHLPASVLGGRSFSLSGSLANVVPGTPALTRVPVSLKSVPSYARTRAPSRVGGTVTASTDGRYRMSFTPLSSGTYYLTTDFISKVENSSLNPVFGDLLAPSSTKLTYVRVDGRIVRTSQSHPGHHLRVRGALGPRVIGGKGRIYLYLAKAGKPLRAVSVRALRSGSRSYDETYRLKPGKYHYQLRYTNIGVVAQGRTPTYTVTIH